MAGSIQRPRAGWAPRLAITLLVAAAAAWPARPAAHEIPAAATVQAIAKPEGQRLRLLLRVPLVSMRDFTFPSRDGTLLDLSRPFDAVLRDAANTWLAPAIRIFEEDRPVGAPTLVAARVSLPSDRSFATYDEAMAHVAGPPLAPDTVLPVASALLDVLFEYRIESDQARFSIDPQVARLGIRVFTVFRFLAPGQAERVFQFAGDPGLVRLDPRWHQAAGTFVRLGFDHILDGIDHLLFLFCLVLPLRRIWQLIGVVTAFTVAHSITLFSAAFGVQPSALWFPPLIETLIAASIVYMALENIVVAMRAGAGRRIEGTAVRGRWMIAFAFGLVHGFGFSFALQETLQLAGSHLVTSLLSFNIGVELGQVLVLVILVPVLALVFRFILEERIGVILASALVVHTAWHWMTERGAALGGYDWALTAPATLAAILRGLMVVVVIAGIVWLWRTRRGGGPRPDV